MVPLQDSSCLPFPEHGSPLPSGDGSVQCLCLDLVFFWQDPQGSHWDHPPSRAVITINHDMRKCFSKKKTEDILNAST